MVLEMDYNQVLEHVQMNNIVLAAAGDGVVSGLDVTEKGTPDMSVDVAAGSCKIGGTKYTESGTVNLAISTADATHARKDLVIYDVATTNPLVITGTPATPPVPPDITSGDILLAIVDVAANDTTITNSEITDCIVIIPKLDDFAAPTDITTLNASISAHGLLKKLPNNSAQYLNGVGTWATPAGAGNMSTSTYDTDVSGVVDDAEKVDGKTIGNANGNVPVSNGTVCVNLNADKLDGYTASNSSGAIPISNGTLCTNLNAARVDSKTVGNADGNVPVSNGTVCINLNAYKFEGYRAGNSSSQIPISNGTVCGNLNADEVDGCDAGIANNNVFKVQSGHVTYSVIYKTSTGIGALNPGTSGYQLTTYGTGTPLAWAAASDLIFSDTHCPKCGQEFQDGDDLILHVIGHNEVGDILTIPMHKDCANQPKKSVTLKRKVFEDRFILDEMTGELVVQRVQKMAKKTVTKHKLKEGYVIDGVTGKAHTVDDKGTQGKSVPHLADAIEEIEETIEEVVYEMVEYEL